MLRVYPVELAGSRLPMGEHAPSDTTELDSGVASASRRCVLSLRLTDGPVINELVVQRITRKSFHDVTLSGLVGQ